MKQRNRVIIAVIGLAALVSLPASARAGCGCDKAPPVATDVRPHATFPGTDVTLFHAALQADAAYTVVFSSGTTAATATVEAYATTQRDLADGEYKAQLVVALPDLPLGPTAITVARVGDTNPILTVDDAALTVVPAPLPIPDASGEYAWNDFSAAVSRDGVVYFSVDLGGLRTPRTFRSHAEGYPLRFTVDDVVFYNRQGFLMQLLDENIPGLGVVRGAKVPSDSDHLVYSRHEFDTYFLQHDERQAHDVDAQDANWHLDGTPHIDHDHLIIAIAGVLADGSLPAPGATPPHVMLTKVRALFNDALRGNVSIAMSGTTSADSYCSLTGKPSSHGPIHSNGEITLRDYTVVDGKVVGASLDIASTAVVTGDIVRKRRKKALLPVDVPSRLADLGSVVVGRGDTISLAGPATYRASEIRVADGGVLYVDNADGPVTVYVTGGVSVAPSATVVLADPMPERFAVYVTGSDPVTLEPTGGLTGLVYAPTSSILISGPGDFMGAFVGNTVTVAGEAGIHFDIALRDREKCTSTPTLDATPTVEATPLDPVSASIDTETTTTSTKDTGGKRRRKTR